MEYIVKNKLFTNTDGALMELSEALKVSFKGGPTMSRRAKAKAYAEYRELYYMDKLRVVRKCLFNLGTIAPSNLMGKYSMAPIITSEKELSK